MISRASTRSCSTLRVARLKAPGWSPEVRLVMQVLKAGPVVLTQHSSLFNGQQDHYDCCAASDGLAPAVKQSLMVIVKPAHWQADA